MAGYPLVTIHGGLPETLTDDPDVDGRRHVRGHGRGVIDGDWINSS